ncbi:MAG: hypothetical protein K1X55_11740 [Chitinophagales bacterium]|nr:hypothetical protein [Chitinophagales bacterium]
MMKSWMIRVAVFVGIFFVLNFLFSLWFKNAMEVRVIKHWENEFYAAPKQLRTLCMGNSHSYVFRPLPEDSTIYFCSYGEDIGKTYYRLKTVLDNKTKEFESIFLPYDFQYLSRSGMDNTNLDLWANYVNYFEYGRKKGDVSGYAFKYIIGKFFPYAGQSFNIWEYLHQPKAYLEGVASNRADKMQADNSAVNCPKDIVDPVAGEYFKMILHLCKQHNIKVYLIKYPYRKDYLDNLSTCFSESTYFTEADKLLVGYKNVHVLDYSKIYLHQPEKFDDGHHLKASDSTRNIFSKMVIDTVNVLRWE